MFEIEETKTQGAKIKVIGVGGAGGNAVNNMIASNLQGVEFITVNTDSQILDATLAPSRVQLGIKLTKGLGAGSDPEIGRQAAIEDAKSIAECLRGCDMVFIAAGMGGGTGTGAAPVIASIARELGILTVAVVTKPFFFEGKRRSLNANSGVKELQSSVDALLVVPNDKIGLVVDKNTPMLKSFSVANDVLRQAVQGITDLILTPGLINLDFADVKTIMLNAGRAVMGMGSGRGERSGFEAAKKAISNPLLEDSSVEGAKGIVVNVTGGLNLSHGSIEDAVSFVHDMADVEANIIFGAVIDPDLEDEIKVTVIATGFDEKKEKLEIPQVKKWTQVSDMTERPLIRKEVPVYRGSERVLAKNLNADYSVEHMSPEMAACEDPLDVPTFIRKATAQVKI